MSSALVAPPVRAKTLALRWISPTALWLRPWALTSLGVLPGGLEPVGQGVLVHAAMSAAAMRGTQSCPSVQGSSRRGAPTSTGLSPMASRAWPVRVAGLPMPTPMR